MRKNTKLSGPERLRRNGTGASKTMRGVAAFADAQFDTLPYPQGLLRICRAMADLHCEWFSAVQKRAVLEKMNAKQTVTDSLFSIPMISPLGLKSI